MAPNPVIHFELPAKDRERSAKFYEKAFNWKMIRTGEEMGNYIMVQTGDTDEKGMIKKPGMINGGIYEPTKDMGPQHPSVVLNVHDIDAHMKIIKDAGGKILGEPMDIPGVGRFVAFEDTEGNRLSILQPLPMDQR